MKTIVFIIYSLLTTTLFNGEIYGSYDRGVIETVQKMKEKMNIMDEDVISDSGGVSLKDDLFSGDLEYSTYIENASDVFLLCIDKAEGNIYKLGFLSDREECCYCKVESLNVKLESNVIDKFKTVQYFIEPPKNKSDEFADILNITYYDADHKVLEYQEKYVYWDEKSNSFYTAN